MSKRRRYGAKTYRRGVAMPIPGTGGVDYCVKYFRTVGNVVTNANNDISLLQEHNTTLGNNNSYLTFRGLYRKAKILSASLVFMPGYAMTNQTAVANNMLPVALTPMYGDNINANLTYTALIGNPATRFANAYDSKPVRIKWRAPSDPPMDWYDTNGVNLLSDTWGGFAIYGDGSGFAANTAVGSIIITIKVAFKESTTG